MNQGLVYAYTFNADGTATALSAEPLPTENPQGFTWLHFDRNLPESKQWINSFSGIDSVTKESLQAEETRPRQVLSDDSLFIILRGVNLNPGADPEDMITLRIWARHNLIVTLRGQHVMAIDDLKESINKNIKFKAPGDIVTFLSSRLIDRMGPTIDKLQDHLDDLEEGIYSNSNITTHRKILNEIRHQAVNLRRYLSPQRDVLSKLSIETHDIDWFSKKNESRNRETTDRITRYVEDLDAVRERAAIVQEEITTHLQDRINKNMYVLSIITTIFLPLSFITGLLGINVGGIPGANFEQAFLVVCGLLSVCALGQLIFFFKKKWL